MYHLMKRRDRIYLRRELAQSNKFRTTRKQYESFTSGQSRTACLDETVTQLSEIKLISDC